MKYCLSVDDDIKHHLHDLKKYELYFHLWSFFYLQRKSQRLPFVALQRLSKSMMIDSGAFSIQFGRNTEYGYEAYTRKYVNFIQEYDNPKIMGFLEMDIDNKIGHDGVLELRKEIEEVTDKVVPVWHKNRGIEEFKNICQNYDYVAITQKSADIKREQLKMFVDYAHKHNCRIHGLGLSDMNVLDTIPFDSCDAISWKFHCLTGTYNDGRLDGDYLRTKHRDLKLIGYLDERKKQIYLWNKWKKYCKWEDC